MLPKRVKHMSDYAWQVLFGFVGFLIFLGAALALGWLVHWMQDQDWVPWWLILGVQIMEILLFIADFFLFLGMVLFELYVFFSGLVASRNGNE